MHIYIFLFFFVPPLSFIFFTMHNSEHSNTELLGVDVINMYAYTSNSHEFGKKRLLVGENLRGAALNGTLFVQYNFPKSEVCTCRRDHVCIPYGNLFISVTYHFIGVKNGKEYSLVEDTFDRVLTAPSGHQDISTPLCRICTDNNNDVVYDKIYASISIDVYEDHKRKKKKKEKIPMNAEIMVLGKR